MIKTKKTIILFYFVIFIAITVLGTIYDLQISKLLACLDQNSYFTNNIFAIIFECTSENILYFLLISSGGILFFYFKKNPLKTRYLHVFFLSFYLIIIAFSSFYCLYKTTSYIAEYTDFGLHDYLTSYNGIITIIILSIIIDVISLFFISKISEQNLKSLWKWAIIVLTVSAISNGIVQGAKLVFDRTRYRAMNYIGDINFEYYTPWYVINQNKFTSLSPYLSDFFKSFPSGHTCASASSFLIILLPNFIEKFNNKKAKITLWSFAISYTLLTALSRIMAGAHFFMDTFIGGFITIIITFITFYIYTKKLNQNDLKNKN